MQKEVFITFLFLNVSFLDAQLTSEKFFYIKAYCHYVMSPYFVPPEKVIRLPLLNKYEEEVSILDSLISELRLNQKSLDWALDSLKPDTETLKGLSDARRRELIYYLYADQLKAMERPVHVRYMSLNRDAFFVDGTGTKEKGFLRLAGLTAVGDALEYGGPLVVSWSRISDTLIDSTRTFKAFNRACEEGVLISRFNNPKWNKPSSLVRCAVPFYGVTAYRVRARVEYDYKFMNDVDFRRSAPYYVFVFIKNGYEYLVAFEAEGGCFNVENLADYLSI